MEPVAFLDRTRRVRDDDCQRARYWSTEFNGRGVEPTASAYELSYGIIVHDALDTIVAGKGSAVEVSQQAARDLAAKMDPTVPPTRLTEQMTLIEAQLLGFFCSSAWKQLLEEYEVISTEVEVIYEWDGLRLAAKPDLLLKRRDDGTIWYVEYKTTKWIDDQWFKQWPKAVQLMAGALGVKQTLGLEIEGCIIQALYKGYFDKKGEMWHSPLVYGWRNSVDRPTGESLYAGTRPKYYKGWERVPVWELGVGNWVTTLLPREQLDANYPRTPPIMIRRDMVQAWLRQSAHREREIAEGARLLREAEAVLEGETLGAERAALLDRYFRQNFAKCTPGMGYACPFLDLCWQPEMGKDPVGSGAFRPRQPHHKSDPYYEEAR